MRRRTWLTRLKAVVLLPVILGGGGGLPVVDLILYHQTGRSDLLTPHFESSAHSHGDICRLGSILPYSTPAESLRLGLVLVPFSYQPVPAPRATCPGVADFGLLPQPRGPPSLSE